MEAKCSSNIAGGQSTTLRTLGCQKIIDMVFLLGKSEKKIGFSQIEFIRFGFLTDANQNRTASLEYLNAFLKQEM